jgi:NAD(P)-dependent dehydrogenase (short-subunit alcohol dehydrogenase family)
MATVASDSKGDQEQTDSLVRALLLACRRLESAHAARQQLNADAQIAELDVSDLASVRRLASTVGPLGGLVCNAGIRS